MNEQKKPPFTMKDFLFNVTVYVCLIAIVCGAFVGLKSCVKSAWNESTERGRIERQSKELEAMKTDPEYFFKKQFDQWDGSHTPLKEFVKAQLKDPDSYKHIKTSYSIAADYSEMLVKMEYSAINTFGARVRGEVIASYDSAGRLINAPVFTKQ